MLMAYTKRMKAPDAIWWDYISGSSQLVQETVDAIRDGKNVLLRIDPSLPWRGTFVKRVVDAIREFDGSITFEDIHDDANDPGDYLVNYSNLGAAYRKTKSHAAFLRHHHALDNRVMWVTAEDRDLAQQWFSFAKEYRSTSTHDGLILIESYSDFTGSASKYMHVIECADFITEYDMLVFAGLLLPDNKMNMEQKRYITTMAVSLLGEDAEGIADFIESYQIDLHDVDQLKTWCRSKDDIIHSIWSAQVQTIFPLIMRECKTFIEQWRERIDDAFGFASTNLRDGVTDGRGATIGSPDEMEIANIRYLMRNKRRDVYGIETDDYILYIPDEGARMHVDLLYDMRNRIAHGKVCTAEMVTRLIGSIR